MKQRIGGLLAIVVGVNAGAQATERPLVFEQARPGAFVARHGGLHLALSAQDARLQLPSGRSVQLVPVAAHPAPPLAEGAPSTVNYYAGNQPTHWRSGVPASSRVRQRGLWRGVDLLWYSNAGQLEYDLIVAPGSSPRQIAFRTVGATPRLLTDGSLQMGALRWKPPVAYQQIYGKRHSVGVRYTVSASGTVGFTLGRYDKKYALVIDPILLSASYLGGAGDESVFGTATDSTGALYVMGASTSGGAGRKDLYVSKISPAGALVYTTYVGGSNNDGGSDLGGIAVDSAGNAYLASDTDSTNFPTTLGAFQPSSGGRTDAVLAKLSPTGALTWASYYGGTQDEVASGIAVNASGQPAIVGQTSSNDLSVTPGALQSTRRTGLDAFVARFPTGGNGLLYGSYFGGNDMDFATAATYSTSGRLYVIGGTYSTDLPIVLPPGSTHSGRGGGSDTFALCLDPDNTVRYSNRLGGSNEDQAKTSGALTVDANDNLTLVGQTNSTDFPTLAALQPTHGGGSDGFVVQLGPSGLRNWATYLGTSGFENALTVSSDPLGTLFIGGFSNSNSFPLDGAIFTNPGPFVLRLTSGGALVGSTFLQTGTNAWHVAAIPGAPGDVWVAGSAYSASLSTLHAFQPTFGGGFLDAFVNRVHFDAVDVAVTQTAAPLPYYSGDVATFTIHVTNNGPDTASSVVLTDTLSGTELADPDNATTLRIVGVATTRGTSSVAGRTVTVNLGTMVPGATATIRVSVQMTVSTSNLAVYSRAVATTTPVDSSPLNNSSTTSLLTRVDSRPRIRSLSPDMVAAGSPDFSLTIEGQGFTPSATVRLNGLLRPTTYVSSNRVTATLRAGDVARAGTARITVETAEGTSPEALLSIGTPRLSVTGTPRRVAGGWEVDLAIRNTGTAAASTTRVTSATLGTAATTSSLPQLVGLVGTGGSPATLTLAFPASAGSSGSTVLARIGGTYSGGTFGGTLRVLLP